MDHSSPNPMRAAVDSDGDTATRTVHRSLGFFVTRLIEHLPDGRQRISHSRSYRKGLTSLEVAADGTAMRAAPLTNAWLRLWAPQCLSWWIAVLFMAGSACFAAGSFASDWPQYWPADPANGRAIGVVFFTGSIFFTAAAGLQLLEAINGDVADIGTSNGAGHRRWRWIAWKPHNAGYSAGLIQFAGTLLFNFNTGDALLSRLTWLEQDVLIWGPDVIGSLCFLVSSYLAVIEVSHRFWSVQPALVSWWIVVINLLGSVAFMASAVLSFLLPAGRGAEWLWGANLFTLVGAMCFFIASYLMIPEMFGAGRAAGAPAGGVAEKPA